MYLKWDEDDFERIRHYLNIHPDAKLGAEEIREIVNDKNFKGTAQFNEWFGRLCLMRLRG